MTIVLNGSDLTVTQVVAAARHGEPVMLAPEALSSMTESRTVVEEVLSGGEPVYGLTTGVGERKAFLLDPAERQRFNHFPGLAETLHRLRLLLAGSYLWQPGAARFLQDPLTFRCLPHINGTARDALAYTGGILQLELNSSQSNPVVVVPAADEPGNEQGRIVSVGNFDIGPLAAALDFARIALAPVVTSANERMVKRLQAPFSGLPAGLAAIAGSADDALPADLEPVVDLVSRGGLTAAA